MRSTRTCCLTGRTRSFMITTGKRPSGVALAYHPIHRRPGVARFARPFTTGIRTCIGRVSDPRERERNTAFVPSSNCEDLSLGQARAGVVVPQTPVPQRAGQSHHRRRTGVNLLLQYQIVPRQQSPPQARGRVQHWKCRRTTPAGAGTSPLSSKIRKEQPHKCPKSHK